MKTIKFLILFLFFTGAFAQVKTTLPVSPSIKTTVPITTSPVVKTTTTPTVKPVVTPTVKPVSNVNQAVITGPVIKNTTPVVTGTIIPGVIKPPVTGGKTPSPVTTTNPVTTPSSPTPETSPGGGGFNPNFEEVSSAVDKLINNDLVKSLFTRQKAVKIEGALGPNVAVQKNVRLLLKDKELKPFFDKINISDEVFDDKNPDAKVIYYLPQSYQIKYSPDKKDYSFNVFYKTADASEGRVIATAQLYPNIDEQDILIAEKILRKELKKDIQLVPLPLNNTPKISFENFLQTNYNIAEADISTHAPTDIFDPITVSWKMDANSANNLVNLLTNNLEIPGNVYFSPNTDGAKQIPVPFKIKFNDKDTFGTLQFVKDENTFSGIVNNSFEYPIVIESANVLNEKGKNYEVKKFETKYSKMQPGASLNIKDILKEPKESKEIQSQDAQQVWFTYSTKTCEECDLGIQEKLLKGTSNKLVKRIEIQVLTPISSTGANSFRLLFKSIQGDPRGTNEVILPMVTIKEDNTAINGGELFILNNDQPTYQYKLIRIDKDASKTESDWIQTNDLLLIIGEKTVTDLIKK
ncbi:hypothetical protein EGI26_09745 [Lacihabitans sp. CCS-44]|uniref:hypothetical protein n=1 Tax=Lacihabitans sp. CCS-44 TaxID=2487331 RepID=UPI0020CEF983|nr:hypothetical protein [Lacihabitans sp. CCS-44]MCP9755435.1 hypothetical protein [Lacihabitans sp. CCS-44]